MNTISIKLSKKHSQKITQKYIDSITIFLSQRCITLSEEDLKELHEDLASYTQEINFAISEE